MGTSGATYRNDNVSVDRFINALPQQTYYADADGDGFGDIAVDSMDCVAPAGYVSNNTDCNDNNAERKSECRLVPGLIVILTETAP